MRRSVEKIKTFNIYATNFYSYIKTTTNVTACIFQNSPPTICYLFDLNRFNPPFAET